MSFDTDKLKSFGISTVKEIGAGSKKLGKAGYGAYKNHDNKKKGLPPYEGSKDGEKEKDDSTEGYSRSYVSTPLISKEQLSSLPPPPRRTGPITSVAEAKLRPYSSQPLQILLSSQNPPPLNQNQTPPPSSHQQSYNQPPPLSHQQSYQVQPNQHGQPPLNQQHSSQSSLPAYDGVNQSTNSVAPPLYNRSTQQQSFGDVSNPSQLVNGGSRPLPPPPPPRTNSVNSSLPPANVNPNSSLSFSNPYHTPAAPQQQTHEQQSVASPSPEPPVRKGYVSPYPTYNPTKPAPTPRQELPDPKSFAPPPRHKIAANASKIEARSKPAVSTKYQPPVKPTAVNTSSENLDRLPPPPGYHEIDKTTTTPPPISTSAGIIPQVYKVAPPKPAKPVKPTKLNQSLPESSVAPPPMPKRRDASESTGAVDNELINPPPRNLSTNSVSISSKPEDGNTVSNENNLGIQTKKQAPQKPVKRIQSGASFESSNNLACSKKEPEQEKNESNKVQTNSFLNELNGSLSKFNINKNFNDDLPITKPTIGKKPKPAIGEKPKLVIGEKPVLSNIEINTKPIEKNTSFIKPELKKVLSSEEPKATKSAVPPPPPRRGISRNNTASPNIINDSSVPPPPPARTYTRPMAKAPSPDQPPNLNLELSTGWFADTNGKYPLDFNNLASSTLWSTSNNNCTRVVTLRLKDLSIIQYTLNWKKDDIQSVRSEITRFEPSPITNKIPSKGELVSYQQKFGEHVASWSEHNQGKQVLRGECWDLAHEALSKGCGKHAFVSTGLHHGFPILQIEAQNGGIIFTNSIGPADEIRRGDILQFKESKFVNKENGSLQTAGMPDHTSVVIFNNDGKLQVLEQNVGGKRYVVPGEYILKNLVQGSVHVYRPVPVEWAGSL